jgi:galactose mutarotase-like enzyme
MTPDDIIDGILKNDEIYKDLAHPIRKARALEYVLKNTRISCDTRDIFPAINMIDRPLSKALISHWKHEVTRGTVPEIEKRRAQLEKDGAVTIWLDYDHSVPVWDRLFELGFIGILEESETVRKNRQLTEKEDAFFEGIKITYEAVLTFIDRLQSIATTDKMRNALHTLRHRAPHSFYEALLLSYLYFIISEHIDNLQVRSLSGFDVSLYRFYKNDLASGVTEEEIRKDLAYYFLQFTAIGNYWNQPIYLGGENSDGSTVINELSYLFLDVYDEMKIYNPKIQIKVSESTPKDLLLKALDMIRRGHNSIVFVGDATIRRALENVGVNNDAARLCTITGCYEYSSQSSYATGMNYLNLLKPLEYTLHGGKEGFNTKIWDAITFENETGAGVRFSYVSPDGEEGYPGELHVEVTYTFTEDNRLILSYMAGTDKPTVCNLTNHVYFNLMGAGTIYSHRISIDADRYIPTDDTLIPTGEIASVEGTPFDFREEKFISAGILGTHKDITLGGGLDHCVVFTDRGEGMHERVKVTSPDGLVTLKTYTDLPAVQLYSGNFLGNKNFPFRGGEKQIKRAAFCLETEAYPDSVNHANFTNTILRPGEEYKTATVYEFIAN